MNQAKHLSKLYYLLVIKEIIILPGFAKNLNEKKNHNFVIIWSEITQFPREILEIVHFEYT